MKKFGALSSSANPDQLAATVSGAILMFSTLIITLLAHFGVPITDSQLGVFAQEVGYAAGSLWFLYGLSRKAVVLIQQRFFPAN